MTEPQPQASQSTATSTQDAEPTIEWYGPSTPAHESTTPLALGETNPYGQQPAGAPPVPPTPTHGTGGHGRPRWVDVCVAAVVAAVVAGGTTAGVLAATNDDSTANVSSSGNHSSGNAAAGTGSGPVSQASAVAPDWNKVATAVEPSVVAITATTQSGGAQGSGVILDAKGRVLTNNHVVAGVGSDAKLTVTTSGGLTYTATVVGTDPSTDLAVIQMKGATNLTPATLGDSDAVKVGAPVMAVGNPLGLAGTVTTGIVSALDRPVTTSNETEGDQGSQDQQGQGTIPGLPGQGEQQPTQPSQGSSTDSTVVTNAIQTDAAVNPGNSGGALVDINGRVIGVPSSIASLGASAGSQAGSIGLGFSIPINEAKSIADQLIADGTAEHPFLGVSLKDGSVKQDQAERNAAIVGDVTANSPASAAGLKKDDAIIAVDGESVNGSESLVAQIRERSVGSKVELTIVRDGKQQSVSATLTKKSAG
ncbi:S1C family serine protease [Angustibacter luteus]|uniref:S1C family serine protease n=1 Tax=Angustibacter luteus TaxID=658456 RepID=A0ABW1JCJ6_9ACTN